MQHRLPYLWIVLPILPLILGFAVLNVLNDGTFALLADATWPDSFYADNRDVRFFNAIVLYAGVALFQVAGCVGIVGLLGFRLRSMQADLRRQSLIIFGLSVLVLIVVNVLARQDGFSGALSIAYRSTCAVLVKSQVAPHILPGGCQEPGLSHLAWLGLLPYLAGILAAASASALVSTASQQIDLETWSDVSEQAFRATAFVLVASTIAMMLFYHLPLSVIEDSDTRALISGFAQSMTLFWGITFTLTLLAVFGPCHLLLHSALADQEAADTQLKDRIADRSAYRQATRLLTSLSPLLVGSSATVIEMLAGALAG